MVTAFVRPLARILLGLCLTVLLAGCGGDDGGFSDQMRESLGDELADCLEDELDGDTIEQINQNGVELESLDEATAGLYTDALTACQDAAG